MMQLYICIEIESSILKFAKSIYSHTQRRAPIILKVCFHSSGLHPFYMHEILKHRDSFGKDKFKK